MKKTVSLILSLFMLVCLCACGEAAAPSVDVQSVYAEMTALPDMPEMLAVPADKAFLLLGLEEKDCAQAVTAICATSLQADEIWLVEAVDDAAAARIAELAQARLDQKSRELKDYLPEQYQVVQSAKLIAKGRMIALLISPQAEELAAVFNSAIGA